MSDSFSLRTVSRREMLRVAACALATPVVSQFPSGRLFSGTAAAMPQGSTKNIPASVILEPAQFADVLSHAGEKPAVICVGFRFLFDSAHIPGAIYRGPGREGSGIVAVSTWAGNVRHDRPTVIYCGCCPWAVCPNIEPAYVALVKMGLTQVKVLRIDQNFGADWVSKGYPTEKKK